MARTFRLTYHCDVEIESPEDLGVETWDALIAGLPALGEHNNGWKVHDWNGSEMAEGRFAGVEEITAEAAPEVRGEQLRALRVAAGFIHDLHGQAIEKQSPSFEVEVTVSIRTIAAVSRALKKAGAPMEGDKE